jgi:hypothetical protein
LRQNRHGILPPISNPGLQRGFTQNHSNNSAGPIISQSYLIKNADRVEDLERLRINNNTPSLIHHVAAQNMSMMVDEDQDSRFTNELLEQAQVMNIDERDEDEDDLERDV